MIINENIETENWHTKGFECHVEGETLHFAKGSVCIEDGEIEYEGFEFDVEGDSELFVVYDVFLLDDGSVALERTELGVNVFPVYSEEATLLHCLMSIEIAPDESLSNLTLSLRNVIRKEAAQDEVIA